VIRNVFPAESFGVFVSKILVEMFPGIGQFFAFAEQNRKVIDEDNTREIGHFTFVEVFIYDIADKK